MALFNAAGQLTAATPAVRRALVDDPEWSTVWQAARDAAGAVYARHRMPATHAPPAVCEREVETGAARYRLVVSGAGGARPVWVAVIFDRRGPARPRGEASGTLGISAHTARRHAERVYSKMGVRSRAALGALLAHDAASGGATTSA